MVASDPAGNFVVVWEPATIPHALTGQRYASSGAPLGGEFRIGSYTTASFTFSATSIAMDSAGNFVVVWPDYLADTSNGGIFGRRYASSGEPLTSEFRVNTTTSFHQRNPSVSFDAAGNFVVVWDTATVNGGRAVGQRYSSSGSPLGTEFELSSSTGQQRYPVVAMQPTGEFVTAFQELIGGSTYHVVGRAFTSAGAPLGGTFQISTHTTGGNTEPEIARASPGLFIVTWKGHPQNFFDKDVLARRVNAGGVPVGSVFQANTFSTEYQTSPRVAASPNGSFVIVWSSELLDFSDYAIIGQRFVSVPLPTGDANGDGTVNVADVFYLINHLFAAGPGPIGKADVDASGTVTVADVFYLINHLFAGGPPPQ